MGLRGIGQVNVVVADADAACRFLRELGIDATDVPGEWAPHHRAVPVADDPFDVDLDSSAFASVWGGLPASFTGVVVSLRVDERAEVDALHDRALANGGRSLKAPYDAFFGSRFAVVEGPGCIVVGLKSTPEEARRSPPPEPSSFT
jgi:predicted lactoylglutathione lyase